MNKHADAVANPLFSELASAIGPSSFQKVHERGYGLIVNADDWGFNSETTDRILQCVLCGSVSSVSAMVFMEDSERSANLARQHGIDAGLHLNLTAPLSRAGQQRKIAEHQARVSEFLRANRYAQVLFNPALIGSFEYVVRAQLEEFTRLYGEAPKRLDGHHHMHLCANVLLGRLLPPGTMVRRSFSFDRGEKSIVNRFYRGLIDKLLSRHHLLTDFFFTIQPLERRDHLQRIIELSHRYSVEMETHPGDADEYRYLVGEGMNSP